MRPRVLALVDGEHYPQVVRAALEQASASADVVAALLLGGTEKLAGDPDYGVPLETLSGDAASSMLDAAARQQRCYHVGRRGGLLERCPDHLRVVLAVHQREHPRAHQRLPRWGGCFS